VCCVVGAVKRTQQHERDEQEKRGRGGPNAAVVFAVGSKRAQQEEATAEGSCVSRSKPLFEGHRVPPISLGDYFIRIWNYTKVLNGVCVCVYVSMRWCYGKCSAPAWLF